MSFFSSLFQSNGLKRTISGALSALTLIPGLSAYAAPIQAVAASVGAVGVGHAVVSGSVTDAPSSTISSILSVVVFASHFIPVLAPYTAAISAIAGIFGVAGVATAGTPSDSATPQA